MSTEIKEKYIIRTHKINIKSTDKLFKVLDDACFRSKNLYNRALYLERQIYEEADRSAFKSKFLTNNQLYTKLKDEECFKRLNEVHSGLCQQTLKLLYQNIVSFKQSIKAYNNDPSKFTGMPKFPKFLNKTKGRQILDFTYEKFKIEEEYLNLKLNEQIVKIKIPELLKGIVVKPRPKKSYTIEELTNIPEFTLDQVRIVPKHKSYDIELVYTKKIEVDKQSGFKVASIDLGINNLVTLVFLQKGLDPIIYSGKYLKSYNKKFNKTLSKLRSEIDKEEAKAKEDRDHLLLEKFYAEKARLFQKRNHYFNTNMHQIASLIIKKLKETETTNLVIGYNEGWKQESKMSKKTNQTFVQIPFLKLVQIIEYKCAQHGINVSRTEESYTSGTSFLDQELPVEENYNKSRRRRKKGLFKSSNRKLINSDVNGVLQITKKIYTQLNQVSTELINYQHPKIVILNKTFKKPKVRNRKIKAA